MIVLKKRHSFTEYVADRFYNEMFSAVRSYAIQNKDSLNLYSRVVQNIRYIELSDIKVVNVFVNNQPDPKIAFDVLSTQKLNCKTITVIMIMTML